VVNGKWDWSDDPRPRGGHLWSGRASGETGQFRRKLRSGALEGGASYDGSAGDVDGAGPVAERDARGLSRRQMIKASAWTAPLIVDSLTSPAAAFSGVCKQYTVKLTPSGACFSACFGGVLGTCSP
jgi:hypothetical protein